MYEWYLASEFTFLTALFERERCIGFVGGLCRDAKTQMGSSSGMAQYSFRAGIVAMLKRPWLVFHPVLISRYRFVLRNIRTKILGRNRVRASGATSPSAAVVTIAVLPERQGQGLGSKLLVDFERIAVSRGFKNLQLTVRASNLNAIHAYERNGWTVAKRSGDDLEMHKVSG